MLRVHPANSFLALACVLGCSEIGGTGGGEEPITAIAVDPAQFLGDVACTSASGGLQRYVATLTDVTSKEQTVLPSSSPTACYLPVHFHRIIPGHQYVADIQGYDRTDLTPMAPGSPTLIDSTGAAVMPRWTASCGRGVSAPMQPEPSDAGVASPDAADAGFIADAALDAAPGRMDAGTDAPPMTVLPDSGGSSNDAAVPELDPTFAVLEALVVMRHCAPLVEQQPGRITTGIIVDIQTALGTLSCGTGENEVASFDATLRETGQTQSAACGTPLTFVDLDAGGEYSIDVSAREGSTGGIRWRTTCFQVARRDVQLRALCDPLVRVDGGALPEGGPEAGVDAGML